MLQKKIAHDTFPLFITALITALSRISKVETGLSLQMGSKLKLSGILEIGLHRILRSTLTAIDQVRCLLSATERSGYWA